MLMLDPPEGAEGVGVAWGGVHTDVVGEISRTNRFFFSSLKLNRLGVGVADGNNVKDFVRRKISDDVTFKELISALWLTVVYREAGVGYH